ncbi:26S proteasome non-ATPase regulatory subunit 12 [Galdieria sulphuraria]|uniref:26S proteasome regulatory subunit N5 n=1 Tax=Galdieria sulphuraria TaxID=130081 RepID=M2XBJ4_GALSU|nr:26S proteasome regulatory subunit N5 [Galdieria sulphuraria]EME27267.1 26S proteasome regulatory subunit N5 [Galdieria sulphuraria]GJD11325.1 26S proteasome non-ATPase regulatory subunit 12 [Galdieria sulphuraria]|eukprot:XP_005703787.1 26S proteasome regulatory subunit N5 [Galdieria sulphuraria]
MEGGSFKSKLEPNEEPMELEITREAENEIQEKISQSDNKPLSDVLGELLGLERNYRLAGLTAETTKVCLEIIRLCRKRGDWKLILEHVQLLSKRRAQVKQAIATVVRECMTYLNDPNLDESTRLEALRVLREVTEGKIFLELERARLTKTLAEIEESKGNVAVAADLMEELQVETFGSMDKREKIVFILEQIRLSLDKGDYIRASVVSRKITPRSFEGDDFEDLRLSYNRLMVRLHVYNKDFLEACKCYIARYQTLLAQQDASWKQELRNAVICILLSSFNNEQNDLLFRISEYKQLGDLGEFSKLLEFYTKKELIQWSEMITRFGRELKGISLLEFLDEKEAMNLLHVRTIEHNLRVITVYYTCISVEKLAKLLDLNPEETEKYLSDQVSSQVFWAKIDRPSGIVRFTKPQSSEAVLNDWSHRITNLLNKVEYTCHLIHRERMVHKSILSSSES